MDREKAAEIAGKRISARFSIYLHLVVYLVVNGLLVAINLETSPDYLWFKWPMMGWGLGLMFHGLSVLYFLKVSLLKGAMLEREIKKVMESEAPAK